MVWRRSRSSRCEVVLVICRPLTVTKPEVGRTRPFTVRSRVVLPEPERPSRAVVVPGSSVRETSSRMGRGSCGFVDVRWDSEVDGAVDSASIPALDRALPLLYAPAGEPLITGRPGVMPAGGSVVRFGTMALGGGVKLTFRNSTPPGFVMGYSEVSG